jgi:hypothetical protein
MLEKRHCCKGEKAFNLEVAEWRSDSRQIRLESRTIAGESLHEGLNNYSLIARNLERK